MLNPSEIALEVASASQTAAQSFFDHRLGGVDEYPCGYAWISIYPKYKGNTALGKSERKVLETLGARKSWNGKTYEIWNPGNHPCQNIDTKEAGAYAGAKVLQKYGFTAYADTRLD